MRFMPITSPATRTYQPELLGLRTVAVGLVILHHWTLTALPLGDLGLMLFLVLSGYLISGLLWKNNIYWGATGPGRWQRRMGVFYLRRALRIVPPYYVALGLAALLPLATLRQHPLWFLLPTANMLCYRLQAWPEGLGHYWTLALEEQFYLLWPLLLTLFRWLPTTSRGLWGVVWFALIFRIIWIWTAGPSFVLVLLPSCLDLFAAGALLRLQAPRLRAGEGWLLPGWLVAVGWLSLVTSWWLIRVSPVPKAVWEVCSPTVWALVGYCTLRWLLAGPPAARWLRHPLMQWLGQRSYGLYLYHLLLPIFYQRLVFRLLPASLPEAEHLRQLWLGPIPTVLVLTPVLVGLSAASWRWLEAPLDKFRRQFAYAPPAPIAK
ncbi:hypothetical protein A0257_09190 [Hymenobacter psoromatis]|nr:hypothetical protein A0257_09190 [Hymenobacter psoromatis]